MRLSEVLNKAPDASTAQVEGFLDARSARWGKHKEISVGKVVRNYFCRKCDGERTFASGETLSCLVTGEHTVSIDVTLRCTICETPMEAWFLVRSEEALHSSSPWVHLERFTENRRDTAGRSGTQAGHVDDLFERAQIAFEDHLGSGSMIYLRKVFEIVTTEAAVAVGISTRHLNNRRKNFRELLEEVDRMSHIVPAEFSADGYKLFSELSEVIHGDSDEADALSKFEPCRLLVLGIVNNIRNSQSMSNAATALWGSAAMTPATGQVGA